MEHPKADVAIVDAFTVNSKLGTGCSGPVRSAGTVSLDTRSTTFPSVSYASTTASLTTQSASDAPHRCREATSTRIDSFAIALRMPFRGLFQVRNAVTLAGSHRLVDSRLRQGEHDALVRVARHRLAVFNLVEGYRHRIDGGRDEAEKVHAGRSFGRTSWLVHLQSTHRAC